MAAEKEFEPVITWCDTSIISPLTSRHHTQTLNFNIESRDVPRISSRHAPNHIMPDLIYCLPKHRQQIVTLALREIRLYQMRAEVELQWEIRPIR